MRLIIYIIFIISISAKAQMPNDAIYMPKNTTCLALTYSHSNWSSYWENTLKRSNQNIGRMNTETFMPMAAIGLSDKLNVIVAVPYVKTHTSAGNLMGQKGLQDLSVWAKYRFFSKKGLSFHAVAGASVPMSNYVPDFLPLSIGLKAKTATARLIANYLHKSKIYTTALISYTGRSKIKIDRDAYFSGNVLTNSNSVAIPNTIDASFKIGYINSKFQSELFIERFACISGDFIRRNDMPFPTNDMKMTSAGAYLKYQPHNLGFNAKVSQVVSGLNVGQSTSFMAGLLYQFNY